MFFYWLKVLCKSSLAYCISLGHCVSSLEVPKMRRETYDQVKILAIESKFLSCLLVILLWTQRLKCIISNLEVLWIPLSLLSVMRLLNYYTLQASLLLARRVFSDQNVCNWMFYPCVVDVWVSPVLCESNDLSMIYTFK